MAGLNGSDSVKINQFAGVKSPRIGDRYNDWQFTFHTFKRQLLRIHLLRLSFVARDYLPQSFAEESRFFAALTRHLLRNVRLYDQHRIAVAVEAIFFPNCFGVDSPHQVAPRERLHQY